MDIDGLKKAYSNLDKVCDLLEKKYGEEGAEKIMNTQMMYKVLLPSDHSPEEIARLADKIAIFNKIKPI